MKVNDNPQLGSVEDGQRFAIASTDLFRSIARNFNSSLDVQAFQEVPLFKGINLNMQAVTDQALTALSPATAYVVTRVIAIRRSGGAAVTCAGGIYTGAAKTGTAIVAMGQSWLNLTAANKIVIATLAGVAATDAQTSTTQFFSLTAGSMAACTADLYMLGIALN